MGSLQVDDLFTTSLYEVPMVRALVCMVTHWTGITVSHDIRLSGSYDFTKMLYYIVFYPWENIELVQKLEVTLSYE